MGYVRRLETVDGCNGIGGVRRCAAVAAVLVLFPGHPARAAFDTGADLLAWCEDPQGGGFAEMYCVGYVTGIADVLEANDVNGLVACVPDDAVVGDLVERVLAYLRAHPDRLGFGAAGLVADALAVAYPCR